MTAATRPTRARPTAGQASPTPVLTLTIAREQLIAALTRAALVSPTKTSLPILTAVKMERTADGLVLTTTDLDRTLTTTLAMDDQDSPRSLIGATASPAVALPAKRLLDVVTQLPPGAVTIAITGTGAQTKARVSCGRARFELLGFAVDEFPLPETTKPESTFRIAGSTFARALARVGTHVSTEQSRPIMGGVLFEAANDGLFLVATDGHHLVRERIGHDARLRGQWIIPRSAIVPIAKLFDAEPTLDIDAEPSRLRFSTEGISLDLRMIGGPYPGYRQIMTPSTSRTGVVDRTLLASAIKRMTALSEVRAVALTWRRSEVIVSAEKEGAGRAEDAVPCSYVSDTAESRGFTVGFQPALILETLNCMLTNDVRLRMGGQDSGVIVEPFPEKGEPVAETIGVVMPLRLLEHPRRVDDADNDDENAAEEG